MKKITVTISETIRVQPYEVVKPEISAEFEVPEGEDPIEFYQKCYREVKKLWDMHLYNHLYSVERRNSCDGVYDYAQRLIQGKEKIPKFKNKQKRS